MIDWPSLLLSPRGRLGRRSYWTLMARLVGVSFATALVPVVGPVASLLLLLPFGCILAKRRHDAGRSAWPVPAVLLLCVATIAVSVAAAAMVSDPTDILAGAALAVPALGLGFVSVVALSWLILATGMASGTTSPNRFGAPERSPVTFTALLSR